MKRGSSGLSLVVGIDKPEGISSHDVVNRCRTIYGERRVGHAGTLDPFASGVLPILIGPATRLDRYLVGHDKHYLAEITFGSTTDTDDCTGTVLETKEAPGELLDEETASRILSQFVGTQEQLPPRYSAIKVNGVKACDAARKGAPLDVSTRTISVYSAQLISLCRTHDGAICWTVEFHVSSGTYIRSLARDIGIASACPAHLSALRRTSVGTIDLSCVIPLQTALEKGSAPILDPLGLLGYSCIYADESQIARVLNGNPLSLRGPVFTHSGELRGDACDVLSNAEHVCVVHDGTLKAMYVVDIAHEIMKAECIFSTGVYCG